MPTAACNHNQNGAHQMLVHCQLQQYSQLEQPIPVVGAKEKRSFVEQEKMLRKYLGPPKKQGDVLMQQSATTFEPRQTTGSPAYGQIGLRKANLFPVH